MAFLHVADQVLGAARQRPAGRIGLEPQQFRAHAPGVVAGDTHVLHLMRLDGAGEAAGEVRDPRRSVPGTVPPGQLQLDSQANLGLGDAAAPRSRRGAVARKEVDVADSVGLTALRPVAADGGDQLGVIGAVDRIIAADDLDFGAFGPAAEQRDADGERHAAGKAEAMLRPAIMAATGRPALTPAPHRLRAPLAGLQDCRVSWPQPRRRSHRHATPSRGRRRAVLLGRRRVAPCAREAPSVPERDEILNAGRRGRAARQRGAARYVSAAWRGRYI